MSSSYSAYRLLTAASSVVLVPLIWLHHRFRGENSSRFLQRMGYYSDAMASEMKGRPRIWFHAVSVGEVRVAVAIAQALLTRRPRCQIALSTLREQGLAQAQRLLGCNVPCFFAPLDLVNPTRRALKMVKPDLLVLLETEIWPNLIVGAKRTGANVAIVNGRISSRSICRYQKIRSLMNFTLSHVDAFSMISLQDAERIQSIGALKSRVTVNGNAKFDSPDPMNDINIHRQAAELYSIADDTPVFVAGSTRNPEETAVLDAFLKIRRQFPTALLIIAPRHIERAEQIVQWVTARGLTCQLRTDFENPCVQRSAPVVILNTIGELSATYSIANIVFCGGSLIPKGGQNIMEPAMWGKPILFGPSMEDFAEACGVIEDGGGGVMVKNAEQIASVALSWLNTPEKARAAGLAARQAILPHRGAAYKHAAAICRLLP